jgi:hypothetical protein
MKHLCKLVVMGVVAVGALLVHSSQARADNRYAVVGLTNQTNVTLNFQYRWGENAEWQSGQIAPGAKKWFYWKYKFVNENRSPNLYIRYDSDLRGSNFLGVYRLDAYPAAGPGYAESKKHAFQYERRNRNFVDLNVIE